MVLAEAGQDLRDALPRRLAEASGIRALQQMAKTPALYRGGLLAYYHAMITSGPLEGTNNNKFKTFTRAESLPPRTC